MSGIRRCPICGECMIMSIEYIMGEPVVSYECLNGCQNTNVKNTCSSTVMTYDSQIQSTQLKPNTLEINIPEGIESIVINFKKNKE